MTEELRKSIDDIRKLTPRLNKTTDDAINVVTRVEAFLSECGVGIPAEVEFSSKDLEDDDQGNRRERYTSLCYDRVQGAYHIAVATDLVKNLGKPELFRCEREDIKPWASCTRGEKLASFSVLPRLLAEIAKQVEKMTTDSEETVKAVDKIIKAMNGK